MIHVVHFQRKPRPLGNFSIESYFKTIRELAPEDIRIDLHICPYHSNGFWKRVYNLFEAFFNQQQINHITGDIHYLNLLMPAGKTLLTVHDCGVLKGLQGFKFHVIKWLWFSLPSRHAGWISVNSEATKRDLLSYVRYDPERIKVIHICVGPQFTAFPKIFNSAKPVILQIGTAENKNLKRIIPALQGIPCQYVIIGKLDTTVKGLLAEHAVEYQSIERALSEEELLHQYQSCDILSFVSTLEGFGMPIVEANGVGRAVVTGNTSSMPEIAGDAAHLVDPLDISAIREGFLKVIDDAGYRNQLIENGFQNVKRFDKRRIAEEYFSLYRRIAEGGVEDRG